MADNVTVPPTGSGTATPVIATDDVGSVHYQKIKMDVGSDGVSAPLSETDPLPVALSTNKTASAALNGANAAVTINAQGKGIIHWEVDTGTLVGTVVFEATLDDTNWFSINALRINGTIVSSITSFADRGVLDTGGYSQVRLRVSAFTSGTSNARLEAASAAGIVRLAQSLPAGTNNIGDVDVLTLPALVAGTANIGDVDVASIAAGDNNIGNVDVLSISAGDNNIGNVDIVTMPNVTLAAGTNTNEVVGDVAADSPAAGNPLLGGGRASAAAPADVSADGDVVTEWRLRNGAAAAVITAAGALIGGDATNGLDVDVTRLPALVAGTANIGDVDVLTLPNVTLAAGTNTNEVVGDVAQDAAAAGNPVLVAGSSETMADSAPANRVSADADASRLSTTDGALFVIPTGPQTWSYHEDSSSALTDASVHAAPGAGLSLYVTDIVCSTGAATALNIFFEEGTTKVLGPYYLEAIAGRGFSIHFGTPKKITANTALTVTTSAAIAHAIDVTGFIAPG